MVSQTSIKKVERILQAAREATMNEPKKKMTSIVLDEDLLKYAKDNDINLSNTLNEYLKYLRDKK